MLHFIYCCLALLSFTFTLVFCPFVSADSEISWNTFLGSNSTDYGYSVAADASGNLYVTGQSIAGWGSPINAHAGNSDAFVAKLDSSGVLQWHTYLGSSNNDEGRSVAVDSSGNLFVTGRSDAGWGSPINAHAGGGDAFVAKLDSDGVLQWHTFLGSSTGSTEYGYSVAADGSGNLYVTGDSHASWGSPINAHAGVGDAFVAKLDSDGVLQWHTFLGSSSTDTGSSVAADASGNLYVTGYSTAGWGSPISAYAGNYDAFVAKLDSDGVLQWHTFLGSSSTDEGSSVAADASGDLYVTGYSTAGWGSPISAHAGNYDAFAAKLDSDGVLQWHSFLGSSSTDEGRSIAADGSGNLYVAGHSTAGWGSPINAHAGNYDAFVAKLDSDGVLQWHTFLGSSSTDESRSIAANGSGNLYVTGYSTAGWGSPINAHAGNYDAFVAKIYDLDIDDDGCLNDVDGCPYDLYKCDPGACGCGVADTDTDGDGTPDCNDNCPSDLNKTTPGTCGCGLADTDSDSDGTPDCNDSCPGDPNKINPGACGCGVADADNDGDGTPDCNDSCPGDPNKINPGACGCGVADADSDSDGTPDCNDSCPDDPNKINPGACGCGVADTDSDSDGTADCNDNCPSDPNKTAPGLCGCETPDTDTDSDGTLDCLDNCPNDPGKTDPGTCGCGVADTDSDSDGTPDCNDECPLDPGKTLPGLCGCGVSDVDSNGDGTADCLDQFALEEIISTSSSGIRYWDVATSEWTQMTSSTPTGDIASGDFTGDGKADVASIWNSGLWYQDGDTLAWTKIPGTAPDRMTAGDVTGDGRFEIIGTWSSGIWYWDVAASEWTKMTTSTTTGDLVAGDFTGDGKADVASIWASGLWYQDGVSLAWTKISGTAPVSVTAGDVTGDGRSEIIGTWSSGIWYWDVAASEWTKMTASTTTGDIAAGDFTGDGKAEVASCWSSGLWYQDGTTFDWTKVSNTAPTQLTAGDVTGQ